LKISVSSEIDNLNLLINKNLFFISQKGELLMI